MVTGKKINGVEIFDPQGVKLKQGITYIQCGRKDCTGEANHIMYVNGIELPMCDECFRRLEGQPSIKLYPPDIKNTPSKE